MRILHLSDTHEFSKSIFELFKNFFSVAKAKGQDFRIPDVVVHTGDIMGSGFNPEELKTFLEFAHFLNEEGIELILVPGNHDRPFDDRHFLECQHHLKLKHDEKFEKLLMMVDEIKEHSHVLINDHVIINSIKFHGFSYQPPFFNWAFNRDDDFIRKQLKKVDRDTAVLLLHAPPQGILDTPDGIFTAGSEPVIEMLEQEGKCDAKLVLFGHVHEQGMKRQKITIGGVERLFANGSLYELLEKGYFDFDFVLKESMYEV